MFRLICNREELFVEGGCTDENYYGYPEAKPCIMVGGPYMHGCNPYNLATNNIISFESEIADCECFQIKLNKIFAWEPTPYVNESQVGLQSPLKRHLIHNITDIIRKGSFKNGPAN